ncbi:unnamed protein product, partial [marine sediment metagenome]
GLNSPLNGEQWGDDWDDAPYEHNAGKVYDEFIKGHCDIVFDFDCEVNELCEALGETNTIYCKDDMKKRDTFCIRIVSLKGYKNYTIKFGDKIEDILKLEHCHLVKLVYK